jgi:hypothetical protein
MTRGEVDLKQQIGIRRVKVKVCSNKDIWGVITRRNFLKKGCVPTIFFIV